MLRTLLFILAGLFSFSCFLIIFAPAAPLWNLIEDDISRRLPDLRVLAVAGTVWEGRAELQYRQFPSSSLSWQLDPIEIINKVAVVQLKLKGMAHEFVAEVKLTPTQMNVNNLQGFVGSRYLNSVSRAEGLEFSGQIAIENINLASDLAWIQSLRGQLYWQGGKIVSRSRDIGVRVFDLPELRGDLSMKDASMLLNIHHNRQSVTDIQLKPDGWVVVTIKARLFDLASLAWPSGTSLDDTVLQYEEKII